MLDTAADTLSACACAFSHEMFVHFRQMWYFEQLIRICVYFGISDEAPIKFLQEANPEILIEIS